MFMVVLRPGRTIAGDVAYEWSPWRHAATYAAIALLAVVVGFPAQSAALSAPRGRVVFPHLGDTVVSGAVFVVCFAAFSVLFTYRRPPGLRLGAAGVELAAGGRDGVLVPWAAAPSVRIRWCWPFTTVEVTIAAADVGLARRLGRGGRQPLRRCRRGAVRFVVPAGALTAAGRPQRGDLAGQHQPRASQCSPRS